MKKFLLILPIMMAFFILASSQAFAKSNINKFDQFRMVNSGSAVTYGGGNPNDLKTFTGTTPIFAFVKIPGNIPRGTDVTFKWIDPTSAVGYSYLTAKFPANRKGWSAFTNTGMDRTHGLWNVEASFKYHGKTVTETRQFFVAPEPMAMVLYGIGGLPLAAHFLRRRKKIV